MAIGKWNPFGQSVQTTSGNPVPQPLPIPCADGKQFGLENVCLLPSLFHLLILITIIFEVWQHLVRLTSFPHPPPLLTNPKVMPTLFYKHCIFAVPFETSSFSMQIRMQLSKQPYLRSLPPLPLLLPQPLPVVGSNQSASPHRYNKSKTPHNQTVLRTLQPPRTPPHHGRWFLHFAHCTFTSPRTQLTRAPLHPAHS